MQDFYEIDFTKIEQKNNADAIAIRYRINGETKIHVVDAGFKETGGSLVEHINQYYDNPKKIDHVILTHPDQDHIGGMEKILENFEVGTLWMNLPWNYADELIEFAPRFKNVDNLAKRLKENYPVLSKLEDLALDKGIEIKSAFSGTRIGVFTVMSPTQDFYIDMLSQSKKNEELNPDYVDKNESVLKKVMFTMESVSQKVKNFIKSVWGEENFPADHTDVENETSIVQFADLCGRKILLTGDAGKRALEQVIKYDEENQVIVLPGLDVFQIPHHGSRRNVSSEVLDNILGEKQSSDSGNIKFSALVSISSKTMEGEIYPRKTVTRAMIHRGGKVVDNKSGLCSSSSQAPQRVGWASIAPLDYPDEQES